MNPISNTAFYCCGVRMEDANRQRSVCKDVYAERFMDENARRIFEPFKSEIMPNISNISRCRIIDDYVSNEIKKTGDVNIVTIGAGFDTRPYRIPGGVWVEVDEPQIIDYKNLKLPVEECINPLSRISIDFANEALPEKLIEVDQSYRTLIVIEGVFIYLESVAIEQTLRAIQQIFPRHVLICDLMTRHFFNRYAKSIHTKLADAGGKFAGLSDKPENIFQLNRYELVEKIPMFRRAGELGVLWDQVRIPAFVARLLLNLLIRDLSEYSVHYFRYG